MTRVSAAVSASAMAALALGSGLNLLAAAYSHYAESRLDRANSERTTQASLVGASLTPWAAPRQSLHGWVLTDNRRAEDAYARYRQALRWAPADPLLWTEYALSLARNGRFDEELERAIERAQALAPHSPAVHDSIAAIGLNYWHRGTEKLRPLWLLSMRYERDHNRHTFLGQVAARGQARTFCSQAGPLLGEQRWCDQIERLAERCRGKHDGGQSYSLCIEGL